MADLERELLTLKREETRLISEIKKAAQQGNQASTRILAKSLVRVRGQQTKIHAGIAQMQGVKSGMTVSCSFSPCFFLLPPPLVPGAELRSLIWPPCKLYLTKCQASSPWALC